MTPEEFDYIGQHVIAAMRKQAGCGTRNCRTELHPLSSGGAQLHHGARWHPMQPVTHQGEIALIWSMDNEFEREVVRSWRADHGMVDLLPDKYHRLLGSYA